MDDKEKLEEAEAQIIENTLRWITWAIEATRIYITTYHKTVGMLRMSVIAEATLLKIGREIKDDPDDGDGDEIDKIYSGLWKDMDDSDAKTSLASKFYELELHNKYIALADECIKELRNTQKILFSPGNKRWNTVKYIDRMYDENDDIFEKRLATTKIEAKKTDHAIEVSHKNAIDSAFRMLTLKLHPDKGGDAERFKVLQEMRDHLLYVDLEHEATVDISRWNGAISSFQVGGVEQDFQVLRKLLQGKSIPKNWEWSEKSIKKMADDGVDTSPFL